MRNRRDECSERRIRKSVEWWRHGTELLILQNIRTAHQTKLLSSTSDSGNRNIFYFDFDVMKATLMQPCKF